MNESTRNHHKPNWKRIHRTWYFWVFWCLTFVAIGYYVVSNDFAFAPQRQMMSPSQNIRSQ